MNRWVRLWSAVVGMVMIGNLQYAWTLFAQPMVKAHAQQHWTLSDVQWGFGLFIAAGTWAMPFLARFIDTTGPRILMVLSGLVCAIGWGSLGHVESLTSFYLLYCLAGVGVACVYACGVAIAVKWLAPATVPNRVLTPARPQISTMVRLCRKYSALSCSPTTASRLPREGAAEIAAAEDERLQAAPQDAKDLRL